MLCYGERTPTSQGVELLKLAWFTLEVRVKLRFLSTCLVVIFGSFLLTGCGSTSTKPSSSASAQNASLKNPCTTYESQLENDKKSIPSQFGYSNLHGFAPKSKYVLPTKWKDLGQVSLYCNGWADYQDLTNNSVIKNIPVVFANNDSQEYHFGTKWDYAELIPTTGTESLIIVNSTDDACVMARNHFDDFIETLNTAQTAPDHGKNTAKYLPILQDLVNNLSADSTVIENSTAGPDTSYVPLLISQIDLGFTQATLQNNPQGLMSSLQKFSTHCSK